MFDFALDLRQCKYIILVLELKYWPFYWLWFIGEISVEVFALVF